MFQELAELFRFTPPDADAQKLRQVVVEENLLGKRTLATRKLTVQRLSELYALDPVIPIYRCLRKLWDADHSARPLLAFLVAYARDPLLRLTTDAVLPAPLGQPVATGDLDAVLQARLIARLNPAVQHKVARNAASSWTQSGHLVGRISKRRAKPTVSPAAATMAVLLGYVTGVRGPALFNSEWTRVLDVSYSELMVLVQAANRNGLLNFRQVGDVIEVQFPSLLRPYEEALCHG